MKKDDLVTIKNTVLIGTVKVVKFDENTGEKRLLVDYEDNDKVQQERWFTESELELN